MENGTSARACRPNASRPSTHQTVQRDRDGHEIDDGDPSRSKLETPRCSAVHVERLGNDGDDGEQRLDDGILHDAPANVDEKLWLARSESPAAKRKRPPSFLFRSEQFALLDRRGREVQHHENHECGNREPFVSIADYLKVDGVAVPEEAEPRGDGKDDSVQWRNRQAKVESARESSTGVHHVQTHGVSSIRMI